MYIGNTGDGSTGKAGITGATFTESPLNLTYVNNVTSALPTYVGTIASIRDQGNGAGIYAAETAGCIGVYSAKSDCSVKLVKEKSRPQSLLPALAVGADKVSHRQQRSGRRRVN